MYVRKFEADTLDEALKNIKQELGPDAIILKTVTNKGLKGAFKKKKIEITAAISEKNYEKKAKVDMVLDDSQKQEFYSSQASYVSNMIDQHSQHDTEARTNVVNPGYGKVALNRSVKTKKEVPQVVKNSLDDFLKVQEVKEEAEFNFEKALEEAPVRTEMPAQEIPVREAAPQVAPVNNELMNEQRNKIDELEKKLFELTKSVEKFEKAEPLGVFQLRTTLRSLDINERYIQKLIRKAMFEFSNEELDNVDAVYEFALREMIEEVKTDMPLFSSMDAERNTVTVLISDSTTGQSSMVTKLGALKKDSLIIRNVREINKKKNFSENVFNLDVVEVISLAEIVSNARKAIEAGRNVIVDFKVFNTEENEVKKFVNGMQRSFENVEVLITLSAIHSEIYNRKVLSTYESIANGIVVTQLDMCLNFGPLFNITEQTNNLPYKFFGTGPVIPDDIESATAERIISGLFQL